MILLVGLDALAAVAATGLARVVRFGAEPAELTVRSTTIGYTWLAIAIVPTWLATLGLTHCYDVGPFGTAVRSRQVVRAGANFLAIVAVAYFVLQVENLRRGFLTAAVPLAVAFSLVLRKLASRRLHARRRQGDDVRRALIVGSRPTVTAVVRRLGLRRGAELLTVGACLPDPDEPLLVNGRPVPVHGDLDNVPAAVEASGADAVVLTGSLAHGRVRRLTWALEGQGIDIFVVPALAQTAIELDVRPVAGLPLVYVDQGRTTPGADDAKGAGAPTPAAAAASGASTNGTSGTNGADDIDGTDDGVGTDGPDGIGTNGTSGTNGARVTGPAGGSAATHRTRSNRGRAARAHR